jgi:hypothetical protein
LKLGFAVLTANIAKFDLLLRERSRLPRLDAASPARDGLNAWRHVSYRIVTSDGERRDGTQRVDREA